jgi:hypothetical protein
LTLTRKALDLEDDYLWDQCDDKGPLERRRAELLIRHKLNLRPIWHVSRMMAIASVVSATT